MTSKQLAEDVFESCGSAPVLDDHSSLIDEGYWYDNKLILAAELGKALLERNRELEAELEKVQLSEREKKADIEFLIKDIAKLREISNQKSISIDEADRYKLELLQSNRQLLNQLEKDREKICRLSTTIACLEEQLCNITDRQQQQHQVETQKNASKHQQKPVKVFCTNSPLFGAKNATNSNSNQNCLSKSTPVKPTTTVHNASIFHPDQPSVQRHNRLAKQSPSLNRPTNNKCFVAYCRNPTANFRLPVRYNNVRGVFIDDDFSDQPELGAHRSNNRSKTMSNSMGNANGSDCDRQHYSNLMIGHYENSMDYELGRAWSWPRGINEIHWDLNTELIVSSSTVFVKGYSEGAFGTMDRCQGTLDLTDDADRQPRISNSKTTIKVIPKQPKQNDQVLNNKKTELPSKASNLSKIPMSQQPQQSFSSSSPLKEDDKCKSHRVSDQLNDLLDDVQFVSYLDRIYNPYIRSQYCDLVEHDYRPPYKQLFQDAFELFNQIRLSK